MNDDIAELEKFWDRSLDINHTFTFDEATAFNILSGQNIEWVINKSNKNFHTLFNLLAESPDPVQYTNIHIGMMTTYTVSHIPTHQECKFIMTNDKTVPRIFLYLVENEKLPIDLLKKEYFDFAAKNPIVENRSSLNIMERRKDVISRRKEEIDLYIKNDAINHNIDIRDLPEEWLYRIYGY